MRLGRPVHDQVGLAPAEDPSEPHDARKPAMSLTHASGVEHLDPEPGVAQLRRPRSIFEEHELELVVELIDVLEHHLQLLLGAAQTLTPWHRHQDAQLRRGEPATAAVVALAVLLLLRQSRQTVYPQTNRRRRWDILARCSTSCCGFSGGDFS